MGGCQNYGLFLGTVNIRCRAIIGTIILTTPHVIVRDVATTPWTEFCWKCRPAFWTTLRVPHGFPRDGDSNVGKLRTRQTRNSHNYGFDLWSPEISKVETMGL